MNEWVDAEERVERAHDLYEKGRLAEAAAELKAAISINPANPAWHFNLALTLEALEDFTKAVEAYKAALTLEPNDVETLTCLGINLTRINKYAEALECFEKVQAIDPNYEPGYCNRIVTYSEMGDHDQAEVMFYLARQVKEDCPICLFNIGGSFYARQRYDQAIQCWRQALKLDKDYPQAHASIAEALWAKGDLSGAKDEYLAELRLDGCDIDTLLDMGELLVELKEYDEAGEKFRRVLEQQPEHAGAHFGLGEVAWRQARHDVALDQFKLVLQIDATYPGAQVRLGQVLLAQGQTRQAVKHFQEELKNCGDDTQTLQELGQLFIEARQTVQANQVLQRLVQLSPFDAQAQHNLAVSYFMLQQIDEGIRHCRKALKIKPDYTLALYNLALAHMQKGAALRARRYLSKALTLEPDNKQVQDLAHRANAVGFWTRLREKLIPRRARHSKLR